MDSCPAGWLAISLDYNNSSFSFNLIKNKIHLEECIKKSTLTGIDIPIGLSKNSNRLCDTEAKKILSPRHMCIFPAPIRQVVRQAISREEASEISYRLTKKKISCQTWNIIPKIKEVDSTVRLSNNKKKVFEVHPELSFYELNKGNVIIESKKSSEGKKKRLNLIKKHLNNKIYDLVRLKIPQKSLIQDDDIIDACAALWSTIRKHKNQAIPTPIKPEKDEYGIQMCIWR